MSEDTEKVEVAPEAIDQIAERVVGLLSAKADEATEDPQIKALTDRIAELETKAAKPARSELEEAGTKAKPGDASPAYGGDDARAEARKAMVSTTAGLGRRVGPDVRDAELWRDIHLATTIAAQFRRVDMPTNPYDLPTETADIAFKYASAENTAVTATNPTTDKATLTAKKIQAEVDFSGEVTEDSIIPIVPTSADLVRKGAQTIDDLVVHGDTETAATGNVNSDDAAPTAGSFYLALDGLRKFCIVTNTGQLKQFVGGARPRRS
jgi:HK97 family phage major capsid protein